MCVYVCWKIFPRKLERFRFFQVCAESNFSLAVNIWPYFIFFLILLFYPKSDLKYQQGHSFKALLRDKDIPPYLLLRAHTASKYPESSRIISLVNKNSTVMGVSCKSRLLLMSARKPTMATDVCLYYQC
ncbi:hypothetical protein AB205_0203140 [Aquarana catesbeiana]|uniref:Uncharacterized protein n=1 Tax=Aquarana catesbeiana TaxID=8400 RepID=A0A2G9RIW9_AQUCT|nr:hypothetical protein AB205_0203140 [Aquarana catesbeiana]